MGRKINDEDYILTNQRTRGTAVIRKNDYEREDAFVWMKGLKIRTDLAHSFLGSTAPEPLPALGGGLAWMVSSCCLQRESELPC